MKTKPDITAAIKTWPQLAAALEVSRTAIQSWRKRPGAPASKDVEEWQSYIEDNNLGVSPNRVPEGREELLAEKCKREIALLDIKVARERRQVVPADEIDELLSRIASGQRAELIQFAEQEAVTFAGIFGNDIGEVRDLLRGLVDRLCDKMETGIERWLKAVK